MSHPIRSIRKGLPAAYRHAPEYDWRVYGTDPRENAVAGNLPNAPADADSVAAPPFAI